MFNKYSYVEELMGQIKKEIDNNTISNTDEIYDYIMEEIDRANIYYKDSFDIVRELNITDFSDYIDGYGAKTISDFGYHALKEYILEKTNLISDLEEYLNNKLEEEE